MCFCRKTNTTRQRRRGPQKRARHCTHSSACAVFRGGAVSRRQTLFWCIHQLLLSSRRKERKTGRPPALHTKEAWGTRKKKTSKGLCMKSGKTTHCCCAHAHAARALSAALLRRCTPHEAEKSCKRSDKRARFASQKARRA